MPAPQPAKILRIHISESDRYQSQPLFEAMVAKCRELRIAGATVFQAFEGFGESAELHRSHLMHDDRPIVIVIVDTAENIQRLIPAMEEMMHTGLLAISDVETLPVKASSD
jgi:uncharacterized protein